MGKKRKTSTAAPKAGLLFPEVEEMAGVLTRDSEQEVVILFIPSHTKTKKALNDQDQWASLGLELLADLFRGATAFYGCKGIFKTEEGEILTDTPILLESFATHKALQDLDRLTKLARFLRRMGKETQQDEVMVAIGTAFVYIKDYSGV